MWLKPNLVKRKPDRLTFSTSVVGYCLNPILRSGFKPLCAVLLIPTHLHKPVNGFHFYNAKTKTRLILVFGRAQPFYFVAQSIKGIIRSPEFDSIDDFERALARYLKVAKFSPEKRPVGEWPPKAMRSAIS